MAASFGGIAPQTYGLYLLTEAALSVSPGPAVLFVASRGLAHGLRGAWPAALGVVLANGLYFILSGLGVGAALVALPRLFLALKWVGALYLLWLAFGAFTARPGALSLNPDVPRVSHWRTLRAVMAVQLSNPKALLFFTAVVPQFVAPGHPVGPQMAWLAAGSMIPEFCILAGYAALASASRQLLGSPTELRWVERACGLLLAGCATLVLAS
jgi:threonine/homoserine/homoserine lactone efflux protein